MYQTVLTTKRPSLFSDIPGKWRGRTLRRGYINLSIPGKCRSSPWSQDRLQYTGVEEQQRNTNIYTRICSSPHIRWLTRRPIPQSECRNVCAYLVSIINIHTVVQMVVVVVGVVVFTLQQTVFFYPTLSAVPPVSFLILHHREMQILWSPTVRQRKAKRRSRIKVYRQIEC